MERRPTAGGHGHALTQDLLVAARLDKMSNSGAWGPTPPGVDLSEDQDMDIIGSVVAIMVIGLGSVVLRMCTRLMKTGPGLAADDYVILFAAVCCT